jgi:3'-phosphoadenosine 5'-phosphosulfate sulfotransferase (PAPS reductase)/FAD synthetase
MKALAFSGGKDSMACLHLLLAQLDCAVYVDTGFAYPETLNLVEYAAKLVPLHVVKTDRKAQNEREGIPADVVPINWTRYGQQFTGEKPVMIQSYLGCCYENLMAPLFAKAAELGVTHLYFGQRRAESHHSPVCSGSTHNGIVREHPIEDWTDEDVFAFLAEHIDIPPHYRITHSSLDCYDCTAYARESEDRIEYTREHHPSFYAEWEKRERALKKALEEA